MKDIELIWKESKVKGHYDDLVFVLFHWHRINFHHGFLLKLCIFRSVLVSQGNLEYWRLTMMTFLLSAASRWMFYWMLLWKFFHVMLNHNDFSCLVQSILLNWKRLSVKWKVRVAVFASRLKICWLNQWILLACFSVVHTCIRVLLWKQFRIWLRSEDSKWPENWFIRRD